jgi:hypothetical protein
MKISIEFTANLVLENIELPEEKAQELLAYFEEHGTLTEDQIDMIMSDDTADLFVEDIIEVSEVCEFIEGADDFDQSEN